MIFPRLNRDPDPTPAAGGGDPTPTPTPTATPTPVITDPDPHKTTIPTNVDPAPKPPDTEAFTKTIPAEYKDKAYLKDVQSFEQLYKKLDGSQELLGKRLDGIPGADATVEQKASFYKEWGRPETAGEYTSPEIKLPEGIERNAELDTFAKDLFHKAGLNQEQVNIIQGGYEGKVLEMGAAAAPDAAKIDAEFEKMTKDTFGDKKDSILKNGNLLIAENTPEALKEHVAGLDNKSLLILSGVLDAVREKYISEDVMPTEGEPSDVGASIADLQKQVREIVANPAYTSKSHKDHARIHAEGQEIYARIDRLQTRQK